MKTEDIQALAAEAAKNIKSEQDLQEFKKLLTKMTLETALTAELDDHLGYDKHEKTRTIGDRPRFLNLNNRGQTTVFEPALLGAFHLSFVCKYRV